MRSAAGDLVDDRWIYKLAAIVHDDVVHYFNMPGSRVYLDFCDMHAITIRSWRTEIGGGFHPGIHAAGSEKPGIPVPRGLHRPANRHIRNARPRYGP